MPGPDAAHLSASGPEPKTAAVDGDGADATSHDGEPETRGAEPEPDAAERAGYVPAEEGDAERAEPVEGELLDTPDAAVVAAVVEGHLESLDGMLVRAGRALQVSAPGIPAPARRMAAAPAGRLIRKHLLKAADPDVAALVVALAPLAAANIAMLAIGVVENARRRRAAQESAARRANESETESEHASSPGANGAADTGSPTGAKRSVGNLDAEL